MDKKLEIVRPDFSEFRKNTCWKLSSRSEENIHDYYRGKEKELRSDIESVLDIGTDSGLVTSIHGLQVLEGVTVCVSTEVTRALEVSHVSEVVLIDIPFPSYSMEFVWEDHELPNCLLRLAIDPEGKKEHTLFLTVTKKARALSVDSNFQLSLVAVKPSQIKSLLGGKMSTSPDGLEAVSDESAESLRYITLLCLKVLAFIAVPEVAKLTTKPKTRAELKAAGVFARGNAPMRPTIHVRQLPRVSYVKEASDGSDPKSTHRFLGRVGHIRHYKAERFSEKVRGTWRWMPPIMPPEGVKIRYIVKAPKSGVVEIKSPIPQ